MLLSPQTYCPSFSTKQWDFLAYAKCSTDVKDRVVPVVKLTRVKDGRSFADSLEYLDKALGDRPAFIDFDPTIDPIKTAAEAAEERRLKNVQRRELGQDAARDRSAKELQLDESRRETKRAFNAGINELLQTGGFHRWIDVVEARSNLVPVLDVGQMKSLPHVLDEVRSKRFAIRFSVDDPNALNEIRASTSSMSRCRDRMTIIIDVENIRGRTGYYETAITDIFQYLPDLQVIVLANSFPMGSLRDHPRQLAIEEKALHIALKRRFSVFHGDTISIPKRIKVAGSNGWFPHVDLVTPSDWHIELVEKNSDTTGYVKAARLLAKKPEWQLRTKSWGTQIIEQVATGDQIVDGRKFTTPAPWLAVRANQHLTAMVESR